MGPLAGRLFCPAFWLALLASLPLCTGCRTPRESDLFATGGPGWRIQEGQALWRPERRMPELAGEIVMASHADGRCVIQFAKTPLTLVLAQTSRTNWLIQFPPRRMGFTGRGSPPTRSAWLYLHAALAGDSLPAGFHFQRKPDGGWRLQNGRSGETLEGFLAP
jgi:hypothetical protein